MLHEDVVAVLLRAVMVQAHDMIGAVKVAHALGINPGGEVKGIECPANVEPFIPPEYRERLLSRDECLEFDRLVMAAKPR